MIGRFIIQFWITVGAFETQINLNFKDYYQKWAVEIQGREEGLPNEEWE